MSLLSQCQFAWFFDTHHLQTCSVVNSFVLLLLLESKVLENKLKMLSVLLYSTQHNASWGLYTWVSNALVEISTLCTHDLREKRHLYKTVLEKQIYEHFEDLLSLDLFHLFLPYSTFKLTKDSVIFLFFFKRERTLRNISIYSLKCVNAAICKIAQPPQSCTKNYGNSSLMNFIAGKRVSVINYWLKHFS